MPVVFFVTGAAGFVGRSLCAHLRAAGHEVRGLVRAADEALSADRVDVVVGDLAATEPWERRLEGVTHVVHCAGDASFGNGPQYEEANVRATERLLAAARRRAGGLQRFVLVSTIGAVDRTRGDDCARVLDEDSTCRPTSDYGRSKLRAERLVAGASLPYSIVRPSMVVGGGMRANSHFAVFARSALQGRPLARFDWSGSMSVVQVDDLARALEICALHPGAAEQTLFCAGDPLRIGEFLASVGGVRPLLPLGWAALLARRLPGLVPFPLKALLLPALVANDARLRALGWAPARPVREALAPVVERERLRVSWELDPGGTCVVTGAASGLGRALALRLAPRRARLLLVDRDREGLDAIAAQYPHVRLVPCDLSSAEAISALLGSRAWREHEVLELFACAGLGARGELHRLAAERQAALLQVNVLARLSLVHAALGGMLRRQFGRVILISSSSAFQPLPLMTVYAASNAAILFLGEGLAAELNDKGVRVFTACPGGMSTNFQRAAGVREVAGERLMPPEEVADAILGALAGPAPTLVISMRAHAMALLARLLPRRISLALWHRLMAKLR